MREVAGFKLVQADAPSLFSDFTLTTLADETPVLTRQLEGLTK